MAGATTNAAAAAKPPAIHPAQAADAISKQSGALLGETWAWIGDNAFHVAIASAIGAVIVIALLAARRVCERLVGEREAAVTLPTIVGRVAQRTHTWFLLLLAIRLVAGFADTPPLLDQTVKFVFTIGVTFQVAIWVRELLLGFVEYRAGLTDHDHSALGSALGIIRLLVTIAIFALATVLVLGNLGVNVTGLIAGLGIGGIAIGLAAQGIFKDLFAALAIIFDRPFRKGDAVRWNNISGSVEAIGLKTTRIRAATGEQVIVGNANLLEKEMFNFARLERRRITLEIGIDHETPDDVCDTVPDLLREIASAAPKSRVVRAGMTGFGNAGLKFELQFDVDSADYNEVFDARSQVCLAIVRRFGALGIGLTYPA